MAETDRFAFDLVAVEKSGPLSRDVTARVTNAADRRFRSVEVVLRVSVEGTEVETLAADLGALDPGESRTLTRTLSVGPVTGMRIKADGATVDLAVRAGGRVDRLRRSLSV